MSNVVEFVPMHTKPCKYTILEYGKVVSEMSDTGGHNLYIQVSKEETPLYLTIGDFLTVAFGTEISKQDFLDKALLAYEKNSQKDTGAKNATI